MKTQSRFLLRRFGITSLLATLVLIMSGCKEDEELPSINVSNLKGIQISEISDQTQLKELLSAWKVKEEVKLKKSPDFDVLISFDNNGKPESWLYAKGGFAKLNSKKDSNIYRVKLPAVDSLIQ